MVNIDPDPEWISEPDTPIRESEALGAYYYWSVDLYLEHCINAAERLAARRFYSIGRQDSPTLERCLKEFGPDELGIKDTQ